MLRDGLIANLKNIWWFSINDNGKTFALKTVKKYNKSRNIYIYI